MAFGSGNPFPFKLGGGKTDVEAAYEVLKQSVGRGGAAADGTLEAEWRLAKARGLAAAFCMDRAIMQFFPHLATDAIPLYEALLEIIPPPGANEEERSQVITDRWTRVVSAVTSDLEAELKAIHPDFKIVQPDRRHTAVTVMGRAFEDHDPSDERACGPAFGGGRTFTRFPNYSTEFVCYVQFGAAGVMSEERKRLINRAKEVLRNALPAWVGYQISQDTSGPNGGFILDLSLLDHGAFS
jgi:hypothetical protein